MVRRRSPGELKAKSLLSKLFCSLGLAAFLCLVDWKAASNTGQL
jgi:hypothetical protein